MYFTFSSDRKLSFIINAGGRNLLVQFGDPNSNGVSTFTTKDPKVANAIRKNSLSRRGIILESSESAGKELETEKKVKKVAMPTKEAEKADVTHQHTEQEATQGEQTDTQEQHDTAEATTEASGETTEDAGDEVTEVTTDKTPAEKADEGGEKAPEEREYDNYTIAREAICKEFGINKSSVRNPTALEKVAQEHGIIITYKEI